MGEENIRKKVVSSFRKAIDFEQHNNDMEAYRNYLEGLALVAAALQQDAESSWTMGNPSFTSKERRSLVGFAKQSVDRLVLLLDKQDHDSSNVFRETSQITDNEVVKQTYKDSSGDKGMQKSLTITPSPQRGTTEVGNASVPTGGNIYSGYSGGYEESPIARMQHENKLLVARYSTRLQAATTAIQRQNLQLELERRLTENAAIARQRQEVWEQRRSEVAARCHKLAQTKFKIDEKIESGVITETDFKKQRVYAAALQYEEENPHLKKLKQDLLYQPHNEKLQRDVVSQILLDRVHPLGSLLCQMQYAILDKVNPIITKHQALLFQKQSSENLYPSHQLLSGIDHELCKLTMHDSGRDKQDSKYDVTEETVAEEERQAFQRHFQNIAIDIKQDIKLLENLLIALIEPLNSEKGRVITTEILHHIYFSTIKPYLIILLRLISHEDELEFEAALSTKEDETDMMSIEEGVKRQVCAMLQQLTSLHSPCQMLDNLVNALRMLASTADENSHCKSLGADDLLPRLMSVVILCGHPSLLAEALYMENFMPTDRALGEGGYSLTVLQSVISCILPHSG